MQGIVQIIALLSCSFLFENIMRVTGQKELGKVIKVCAWVICAFWILGVIGDMCMWIEDKLTWIDERLMFIRNIFDWGN